MTPPINIDGTNENYSSVTIDGQTVEQITIDGQDVLRTIPDSATHQWKLDEGTGTTISDSVGSATATNNGATWVNDSNRIGGYELSADGTNDYVDLTSLSGFGSSLGNGFAWIFTMSTTDQNFLFGIADGNQEFNINTGNDVYGNNGSISLQVDDNGNSNTHAVFTDRSNLTDGGVYRVVCQCSNAGDTSTFEIFVNGSQESVTQSADQGSASFVDFSEPITMFANNDNGTQEYFINANIDNVIVTDSPLTASKIQEDYNKQPWS